MKKQSKITLHPSFRIGEISPRLFGGFLEPSLMGTVHGYLYNPNLPDSDEQGFRRDVIDALKATKIPSVRLPGGNFVSCWDWKDSIGPKDQRKVRLDLAWHWVYENDIGHDEYLQWAEKVGFEPMVTINLGTGDINDAMKIVEYTNHKGGTWWSDLRVENGHPNPYGVKIWFLGNEMDGPWQLGSWDKDPRGYGIRVHEISKAMKFTDGSIQTVACVSSSPFLAHYPQWDLEVLEQCYETVDYISLHHYHSGKGNDIPSLLAGSEYFEDYIRTEIALCDFVKTKLRSTKTMMLTLDEWGSNPGREEELHYGRNGSLGEFFFKFNPDQEFGKFDFDKFQAFGMMGPRGNEMVSTLASTSLMLLLLRHADRIKIGCMTGGLYSLARASRDKVWKTLLYYPYEEMILNAKGISLMPEIESDTYDVPGYATSDFVQYDTHTGIKFIEAAAALNEEKGELRVYAINRDWEDDSELTLDVSGFGDYVFCGHEELYNEDPDAHVTYENPDAIVPKINKESHFEDGCVNAVLRKLSFNVFCFRKQ